MGEGTKFSKILVHLPSLYISTELTIISGVLEERKEYHHEMRFRGIE